MNKINNKVSIIGCGNIGSAIAHGLNKSGLFDSENITLTRRNSSLLNSFKNLGFKVELDNKKAVRDSEIIILTVLPQQFNQLLDEIKDYLDPKHHIIISVVTGVSINQIQNLLGTGFQIVRAMPNTAIQMCESMTCLSVNEIDNACFGLVIKIFDSLGVTIVVDEKQMIPATSLCACGIAFFLRAIRAASQGGIEIGFHAAEALLMAAQTAKGAASLVINSENHPESEIDKVTTPQGCTISGLNEMEHQGFSSAMIKGIKLSSDKASGLYKEQNKE